MTLKRRVHLNQTLVTEPRGERCPLWEGLFVYWAVGGDSGMEKIPKSNKTYSSVGPFIKCSSRANCGALRVMKDH